MVKGGGQEELPYTRGQGRRPGATPHLRPGAAAGRSNSASEARGRGRVEQPHVQGVVAVWAQEGLEELFHIQGQKGRLLQGKEQQLCFAGAAVIRTGESGLVLCGGMELCLPLELFKE